MIDYLITCAGKGSRTRVIHPTLPKFALQLNRISFLAHSIRSLDLHAGDRLHIIHSDEDNIESLKSEIAMACFVEVNWIPLQGRTKGQLETAYLALKNIKHPQSVVIYNCDTFFRSRYLNLALNDLSIEGIIPCFKAQGNSWSFCQIEKNFEDVNFMPVTSVEEKKRISDYCSVGYYFFRNPKLFFQLAEEKLSQPITSEYFVAPLYNDYIKRNLKVVALHSEIFKPFGSLEQIHEFWNKDIDSLRHENSPGTLVVDLDLTIAGKSATGKYKDCPPLTPIISKLKFAKKLGYKIVIFTARRMRTFSGDESFVIGDVGKETIDWLIQHDVPFDGLKFGKPWCGEAGLYIDDKAISPQDFMKWTPPLC